MKMRGVNHSRFEDFRFEILNLAVERGEVRFKDVYELARTCYDHISTKTVSKYLRRMVKKEYLERVESEVTKRPAYKILPRGVEEYWLRRIIKELRDLWPGVSDVMDSENEGIPTETIISRYETVVKGLQTFFLFFLPQIKEMHDEEDRERALTEIANLNGKLFTEICMVLGRFLLHREDANKKVANRFEEIYCEYEAAKKKFFETHPEEVRKMLDIIKDWDGTMKRIRNRLKSSAR